MTWYNNNAITPAIDPKNWHSVASDSSGTKFVACENGGSIWTKTGNVWEDNNTGNKNWTSVASNSSGSILIACEELGSIWTNVNGAGWFNNNVITSSIDGEAWTSVATDSSGTKLIACAARIWTKTGTVWVDNNTENKFWTSVASNSDGSILIACEGFGGGIWKKIGNIWAIYFGTENKNWTSVASNSSGSILIACDSPGSIWTNVNDAGWSENNITSGRIWNSVASNSDGSILIACVKLGSIWTNVNDAGWIENNTTSGRNWYSVASNSDGSILIAGVFGESIWTYPAPTPPTPVRIICFKEGTTILTIHGYKPIEDLRTGDLIKTLKHGYIPIYMIGKRELYHEASPERIKNQLYTCSKEKYPEIFEDLIITGCHSILVFPFANEEERHKTIEVNGDTYVTDGLYRLPACVDSRASVYETPGTYTIYHFSLENDNYYSNYGVYANGLVVESCSKRMLKELSNMTIF